MRLPFCVGWRGGWVQLYDHMYFLCSVLLCCFSYCYYSNFALFLFCFFFHLLIIGSGWGSFEVHSTIHEYPFSIYVFCTVVSKGRTSSIIDGFSCSCCCQFVKRRSISLWMIQTKVGFHCLLYGVVESTVARHITIHKWK